MLQKSMQQKLSQRDFRTLKLKCGFGEKMEQISCKDKNAEIQWR